MLITEKHAEEVRVKRGRLAMTRQELTKRLGITAGTLRKVERGDYDAPRRIYNVVMEWLAEDY